MWILTGKHRDVGKNHGNKMGKNIMKNIKPSNKMQNLSINSSFNDMGILNQQYIMETSSINETIIWDKGKSMANHECKVNHQ